MPGGIAFQPLVLPGMNQCFMLAIVGVVCVCENAVITVDISNVSYIQSEGRGGAQQQRVSVVHHQRQSVRCFEAPWWGIVLLWMHFSSHQQWLFHLASLALSVLDHIAMHCIRCSLLLQIWSVCVSVFWTLLSLAKIAEVMEMPFGVGTLGCPRNHVGRDASRKGQFWRVMCIVLMLAIP